MCMRQQSESRGGGATKRWLVSRVACELMNTPEQQRNTTQLVQHSPRAGGVAMAVSKHVHRTALMCPGLWLLRLSALLGPCSGCDPAGQLSWKHSFGLFEHSIHGKPAVAADGTIFVGSADNSLYALTGEGSLSWRYATGGPLMGSPTLTPNGMVLVGSYDNQLYALTSKGRLQWNFTTGSWIASAPAVGADGTVYVTSEDHKLYALTAHGTLKWSFETGGSIVGSPTLAADGTVYAPTHKSLLSCHLYNIHLRQGAFCVEQVRWELRQEAVRDHGTGQAEVELRNGGCDSWLASRRAWHYICGCGRRQAVRTHSRGAAKVGLWYRPRIRDAANSRA